MWNDSSTAVVRIYHSEEGSDGLADSWAKMPSSEEYSNVLLGEALISVGCDRVLVDVAVVEALLADVMEDGVVVPLLLDDLSTLSSCWSCPCIEFGLGGVFLGGDEVHALAKITRFVV